MTSAINTTSANPNAVLAVPTLESMTGKDGQAPFAGFFGGEPPHRV